jgi:predicted ArsR family transcriptional regulator
MATPDRLAAAADPDLREVLLVARRAPAPVTADEVASELGLHHNVARARLDRLAAAGLLTVTRERRSGRSGPGAGRPSNVYAVPPELEAIEFPQRGYAKLVALMLELVPLEGRAEALRRTGERFGRQLAERSGIKAVRDPARGLERMCQAVGELGFQASVEEADADGGTIATPTCPLRPLVAVHPSAALIDEGMWAGLAGAAVAGLESAEVECETLDCFDSHASCRVRLRFARQHASASGATSSR